MTTILHDKAKCNNGHDCQRRMDCVRWITPSCGPEQIDAAFYVAGAEMLGVLAGRSGDGMKLHPALISLLGEIIHVALIIAVVYGLGWVFATGMISALDNVTWTINGKVIAADTGLP